MAKIKNGSTFIDGKYIVKSINSLNADSSGNINIDIAGEVNESIVNVELTDNTGVFVFTKKNGTQITIDSKLEKVITNFTFDEESQSLKLTLEDGTSQEVPLSSFIKTYSGKDGEVIQISISPENEISAILKNNTITKTHLATSLVEEIDGKANKEDLASQLETKSNIGHTHQATEITESSDKKFMTSAEKTKLEGIENQANKYEHPATHSSDMIMVGSKTLTQAISDGDIGGGSGGIILDSSTKKTGQGSNTPDTLADNGQAITYTGNADTVVAEFKIDSKKIKLGKYSMALRLKVADNSSSSNIVKISINKENSGGVKELIKDVIFTGTDFEAKNSYSWLTTWFNYEKSKLEGDKISISVNTVSGTNVSLSIDYIIISPIMSAQYILA